MKPHMNCHKKYGIKATAGIIIINTTEVIFRRKDKPD
jgi:hypothetical protein